MPTALELGHEGWKQYLKSTSHQLSTSSELTSSEKKEREHLLGRVKKAAVALKARFHVRHVILFGSLAHEGWFRPNSDVDLAIEGLAGHYYWQAWQLVEEIIDDRSVDFIDLETSSDSLRQAIQRSGVEL